MTERSSATATTHTAREHARSMAGTSVETMPTLPPSDATPPAGIDPDALLWHEVMAGGGYTTVAVPRGGRVRLVDRDGDACAAVLLHRLDRPSERLNVADTVKVQWQAYLSRGQLLLSDMGRVLASIETDTSGHHDTMCGTSTRASNEARYGDGAIDGPSPAGRELFGLALGKAGFDRRDIAPNINLFRGVRVLDDGALSLETGARAGAEVVLRAELDVLVSIVNVPHPLDDRPDYTVSPLIVTAWRGPVTALDDPIRNATPEGRRAFLNSEAAAR